RPQGAGRAGPIGHKLGPPGRTAEDGRIVSRPVARGAASRRGPRRRPLIAFFDYPDVFEDFYTHYAVDQRAFATTWAATGSHAFVALVQREVGDVVWYSFSVAPELEEAEHQV